MIIASVFLQVSHYREGVHFQAKLVLLYLPNSFLFYFFIFTRTYYVRFLRENVPGSRRQLSFLLENESISFPLIRASLSKTFLVLLSNLWIFFVAADIDARVQFDPLTFSIF